MSAEPKSDDLPTFGDSEFSAILLSSTEVKAHETFQTIFLAFVIRLLRTVCCNDCKVVQDCCEIQVSEENVLAPGVSHFVNEHESFSHIQMYEYDEDL